MVGLAVHFTAFSGHLEANRPPKPSALLLETPNSHLATSTAYSWITTCNHNGFLNIYLSVYLSNLDGKVCACRFHINNTCVICCTPKTFYGVFPHLLMIHWFPTLLIRLSTIAWIKCSVCLYLAFWFFFFFQIITFGFYCIYLLPVKHNWKQLKP